MSFVDPTAPRAARVGTGSQAPPGRPAGPGSAAGQAVELPTTGGRVCFLYIAQEHQTLHSVTAAVELARLRRDVQVDLVATSQTTIDYLQLTVEGLGGSPVGYRLLGPAWLRGLKLAGSTPMKLPMLLANAHLLAGYDVIVTPERTTAALRSFGVRGPRLVYTQHGAGDRGGPFEPRLRKFDLVFAAGPKQRDRMTREGLVTPERCAMVGYPKFDLVDALSTRPSEPFGDDRPVVLYNPHFDPKLSSWPTCGSDILAAFAAQDRYNLIFAPHIRLFGGADPASIRCLAPFLGLPRIHLDLGGPSAIDMTYTRRADLYLGDASSQVYEFLRTRKPCLFLDAHATDWRGKESYRHWTFGPVVEPACDILSEVDAARRTHEAYLNAQDDSFRLTFDITAESSSARAARAIAGLLRERAPSLSLSSAFAALALRPA